MSWTWASLSRSPAGARASTCDDINVLPAPHDVEALELQASIRGAFAGGEIIFVAMPGADEMNFFGCKFLTEPGAVGADDVFHLVDHEAFTSRSALVHAKVLIGVELALPMEDADFAALVDRDAAL